MEDAASQRTGRDAPNKLPANQSHGRRGTRNSREDQTHTPEPFPETARWQSNEPEMRQPARPPRIAHPTLSTTPDRHPAAEPAEPASPPPSVPASQGPTESDASDSYRHPGSWTTPK